MTRPELIASLASAGLFHGSWDLDDITHDTISADFVIEAHAAWVMGLPRELVTGKDIGGGKSITAVRWLPEVFDCDNIARDFGAYLSRCMAVDAVNTGRRRGNVAAGKFNFYQAPDSGHAVNWFVDHEGKAHCFDAASEILDGLTPAQIATIFSGEST